MLHIPCYDFICHIDEYFDVVNVAWYDCNSDVIQWRAQRQGDARLALLYTLCSTIRSRGLTLVEQHRLFGILLGRIKYVAAPNLASASMICFHLAAINYPHGCSYGGRRC